MTELTKAARKITKPTICDRNNSWISEKSWKLVDAKVEARRAGLTARAAELEYGRKKIFACDREKVLEDVATEITAQHARNNSQAACQAMQKWYKNKLASRRNLHQSKQTESERNTKHSIQVNPHLPIRISPCPIINNSIPTENEIVEELNVLHNKKSPGASGSR
jgi:hypothetical protein